MQTLKQVSIEYECAEVWIRASQLSSDIYLELIDCPDFDYWDEITQIGHAISAHIAEGRAHSLFEECIDHLIAARKACKSLLRKIEVGLQVEHIEPSTGDQWISETKKIAVRLTRLAAARKDLAQPA